MMMKIEFVIDIAVFLKSLYGFLAYSDVVRFVGSYKLIKLM